MARLEEDVGKETSPRKASAHKDKGPLHLGPRHQEGDGRKVRVALDFRRHSQEGSGQQDKVPRVH